MMFEEAFVLVDSLELEQPPDFPIVGIGSLDISAQGDILVTDPREARVSLFSPAGELHQVFGRRGEGAGEFEYPSHARFDKRGDIHVVDMQRRLISVFARSGNLMRDIHLPPGLFPNAMEVTEHGEYWVPGTMLSPSDTESVLFKLDSLGIVTAEYLPLANARPRGEQNHHDWNSLRTASITMGAPGPYASFSLLDSVWAIDEASGMVRSWAIRPDGYTAPSLPEKPIRGGPAMMAWLESSQRATGIWGNDSYLLVAFASGIYHRAESSVASYRDVNGTWHTLLDTPVILRSMGSRLVAFAHPVDERVVINMFELR
ncbi:MAG: 6-bladed beta-propeller [Gemmatimonadota bacterium]|nr:6-bladed beta-propeller [Gemmatimonadota bacterium]